MSWFNEGYETVEKESQRIDEAMNQNFIPTFILKEDEDAKIVFLTDKPVNFYQHYVKALNKYFTCSGQKDCPLCMTGNKAGYKGAYLILDTRYEEWQKDGKTQSRQNTVKVMTQGIKALKVIKKHDQKRGLANFAWEIERTGSGTDTTYTLLPESKDEVINGIKMPTEQEIADFKKQMIEGLAPKDRNTVLDLLAGRTSSQGNSGGGQQQQNSQPQGGVNFNTDSDDSDPGVLRFM